MFFDVFAGSRLAGRRGTFYGISLKYRRDNKPFLEDLPKIFALVAQPANRAGHRRGAFRCVTQGRRSSVLATGTVEGKIVLTCD